MSSLLPTFTGDKGRSHIGFLVLGGLVGAAIGLLLTVGVAMRSGDPSTLVHFAPPNTHAEDAPEGVLVLPETRGYDGQFYYRLAVVPFSTAERVEGVALDHPALRMTRIGYPTAAKLLAAGPVDVVESMLLTNVLAFTVLGVAGVSIASTSHRHPFAGLAVAFVPAFIYGATMSVTDALAGALLVAALAALTRSKHLLAGVLLSGAALTRETALLFSIVVFAGLAYERIRGGKASDERQLLVVGILPMLSAILWQSVVVVTWRSIGPLDSGGSNLTLPLLGPFVTDGYFSPETSEEVMNLLVPGATLGVVALAAVALLRGEMRSSGLAIRASFLIAAVLAVSLGPALLETYRSSVRGMGDAVVFGVVGALLGRGRWSDRVLLAVGALGAVLMAWEIRIAPDIS